MKKVIFLTCITMLFISTAAHARGECTRLSLQIEDFCNQSLIDIENKRSVENTYKRCVVSIPDGYESIITANKSSNLYEYAKKACWRGTHSGLSNCNAMGRSVLNACETGIPDGK